MIIFPQLVYSRLLAITALTVTSLSSSGVGRRLFSSTPLRFSRYLSRKATFASSVHHSFDEINRDQPTSKMSTASELSQSIREIYTDPTKRNVLSVYTTGGGVNLISWLFSVPGASNSLVEARVPYAYESLFELLGTTKETFQQSACSPETSIDIARAGFQHTCGLFLREHRNFQELDMVNIFAIACTAALVTDRPKKGPHHCYVASYASQHATIYSLDMIKNARIRPEEDELCSRLGLDAIRLACGLSNSTPHLNEKLITRSTGGIEANQQIELSSDSLSITPVAQSSVLENLSTRKTRSVLFTSYKQIQPNTEADDKDPIAISQSHFRYFEDVHLPVGTIVYPGSFNPLHEGHVQLLVSALHHKLGWTPNSGTTNPLIVFELALINADKPPIAPEVAFARLKHMLQDSAPMLHRYNLTNYAVVITADPLFIHKSALFRDCTFLIGADTLTRLIDPKYYRSKQVSDKPSDDGPANLIQALSTIKERGCSFIVGGRATTAGSNFETLESIQSLATFTALPDSLQTIFYGLTENEFRVDISSTQLRNAKTF